MLPFKKLGGWLFIGLLFFFLSPATQAQKLTDPEIASVAVTANQIDVNYGKLALEKSNNADIKKFAQTMINDHENIIRAAGELAGRLNVTPKTNSLTQSLLDGEAQTTKMLKGKKGRAFDKAYADNEAAYHKAVIEAVRTKLIPETDNAELKDLLESVMPLLEHHQKMADDLAAQFK